MGRNSNEYRDYRKKSRRDIVLKVIYTLACLFVIAYVLICSVFIYRNTVQIKDAQAKIVELQDSVSGLGLYSEKSAVTADEYREMISFLESETARHREFIENQRQFLIWLVGAVGAVAILVMGFVGLSNKKDIKETIEAEYKEFIDKEFERRLNEAVGGNENINYLEDAVEMQKRIREKKVVFIYEEGNDSIKNVLQGVENKLKELGIETDFKKPEDIFKNGSADISGYLSSKYILVYGLSDSEFYKKTEKEAYTLYVKMPENSEIDKWKDGGELSDVSIKFERTVVAGSSDEEDETVKNYIKLYEECKGKDIYCLFYAKKTIDNNKRNMISENSNMGIANTGITLYQTLNAFLNM